jgi:two-component system sensor histidine kinase KdpD
MPFIKVDFILLEQVLKNLIQNSLFYTHPESVIELQAGFDNNNLYIIYSDNGSGISDDNLNHIFDKFYRVDKKISGGTGLGLSIAKGIVEAHKGTITAANKKSGGLKFTIEIPQNFEQPIKET